MTRISIVLIFLTLFSCQTKNDKVVVPKSYIFQINWGTYWDNQHIHKIFYSSSHDSLTFLTHDYKDSVISFKKYKIDKILADSIFILGYQNNLHFDILDTNCCRISDSDNLSISLSANDKTVSNSFISYVSHASTSREMNDIINIINRVTNDTTLFTK